MAEQQIEQYIYTPGFRFKVIFPNFPASTIETAFQEVSGISMSATPYVLEEGGVNYKSLKLPGRTTYSDLELKRGLLSPSSPLTKWCYETFGNKSNGEVATQTVDVQLLNEEGTPSMTWSFYDAYPIKWEITGFNAQESAIVIASITLAYSSFECK